MTLDLAMFALSFFIAYLTFSDRIQPDDPKRNAVNAVLITMIVTLFFCGPKSSSKPEPKAPDKLAAFVSPLG